MTAILILKTAALGDVLRTTSILPGLQARHADLRVTWVTAPGAVDLVRNHPRVDEVVPLRTDEEGAIDGAVARLSGATWDRLLSFDDEDPLCRLATLLPTRSLSGAYLDEDGSRAYTDDVAPWFDMGLISRQGKERADLLKLQNRRSHPAIYADMLGVEVGRPLLPLPAASLELAHGFACEQGLDGGDVVIGLNTGAGGRWRSKALPVERVVRLASELHRDLDGRVVFLVLGGPDEARRNRRLVEEIGRTARVADAGTENSLLDFAGLVGLCSLLITSDSLALHLGVAGGVRTVAFFAPTSAAEIELYGLGEKLRSTAPDYGSYRPDADTSTLTVARLRAAVLRQLELVPGGSGSLVVPG